MGRKELKAKIVELSSMDASEAGACLNTIFPATAHLLKEAEPEEDGAKRVEVFGGFIATLHKVEERTHHGPGAIEGTVEPAHYRLDLKLHKGALDRMTEILGIEVKNG